MSDKKVTLTIDGREITVAEGTLVIRAAEQLGLYVPRFCDHPYLKPLGACRQCMVEVEGQRKPLTSCTTVCTDGMVVKTQFTSEVAQSAQEGVLELLLINHPLDCPQCDKGGECPLQDQTLAYGPGGSRFGDVKRRFVKPVPVNDLVYLDRERCVLCARCTRFAAEISGDPFIELFERGALEQVAIFEDDPYESNFSGNVIQICPVGALTSKRFRFVARPFDMTSTDSTCTQCASGCSITIQERRNGIVRVLAGEDPAVNDVWSCDRGRFGHAYVGDATRVVEPMVRKGGELVTVPWVEAVRAAADHMRRAREDGAPVAVLAGGNLLDEDAYALSRFARTVLGTNDIALTTGVWTEETESLLPRIVAGTTATNETIDNASLVVVIGSDLYEESPIIYLRVRKAYERGAKIVQLNTRRAPLPGEAFVVSPDEMAVAVGRLEPLLQAAGEGAVVLAGVRLGATPGALTAAWEMAERTGASFGWVPRKGGARGALAAGLHPTIVPAGADALWSGIPAERGRGTRQILEQMAAGRGLVLVVGADPVADYDDLVLAERAVKGGATMIALDMFRTPTTEHADVFLPAAAPPERDGTITNWEGRRRTVRRAVDTAGFAIPDWEILGRIASEMGREFPKTIEQLRDEMSRLGAPAEDAPAPAAAKLPDGRTGQFPFALVTYRLLLDHGTMSAGADELKAASPAPYVELNHADAERLGVASGDRVRLSGPRGAAEATARVGDSVAPGVVFAPASQPEFPVCVLADLHASVPGVAVEKV